VPRPNLFVIGAMKSGTTSLHSYLDAHPSIFMVPNKEPTHFVDGDELRAVSPLIWEAGFWRDRRRYLDLFAAAGDAPIIGESSTNYSKRPMIDGVADRIADYDPKARIVYLMRDPVERTLSHYWHLVRWHDESRDPLAAVRQDPRYRAVSHYAMQITPYLERFGHEQVKPLTLESLKADPAGVMAELYRWLGVDAAFLPPNLGERRNVAERETTQARGHGLLRRFRRSRAWARVAHVVPAGIRGLGRDLAEKAIDRDTLDMGPAIDYLRPLQQQETRELSEVLRREFPEWKTLAGDAATR